jgi:hypothetical protein
MKAANFLESSATIYQTKGVTFQEKMTLLRPGFPAFNYPNVHHRENIKFRIVSN